MIPDRLLRILRTSEDTATARFPPTEIFNEGWMLRLTLDAIQSTAPASLPFKFEPGANWYSEVLLSSPFGARQRADSLAEGFTNADGVVGQFDFRPMTRAGLELAREATQFVVVEAKMFSNLSSGTKNAAGYNQAARNVACMARATEAIGRRPDDFTSLGFFVAAPVPSKRRPGKSNLEEFLAPDRIKEAVRLRIGTYEAEKRQEAQSLREWEANCFLPLVNHLAVRNWLRVLTWEDCIDAIFTEDRGTGSELQRFYERCLTFGAFDDRAVDSGQ